MQQSLKTGLLIGMSEKYRSASDNQPPSGAAFLFEYFWDAGNAPISLEQKKERKANAKINAPGTETRDYIGADGHLYREHIFTKSGSFTVEKAGEVSVRLGEKCALTAPLCPSLWRLHEDLVKECKK